MLILTNCAEVSYSPIIVPAVALAIWSLLLFLTLFPSVLRVLSADPPLPEEERQAILTERSSSLRDHPVVFYVLCLALAYIGAGRGLGSWLAWAFATSRGVSMMPEFLANERLRRGARWIGHVSLCALALYSGVRVARDMLSALG